MYRFEKTNALKYFVCTGSDLKYVNPLKTFLEKCHQEGTFLEFIVQDLHTLFSCISISWCFWQKLVFEVIIRAFENNSY